MIGCLRARRRLQADCALQSVSRGNRHGSATGADVTARHAFAKGFCAAGGFLKPFNIEEDLVVTISPELEAQILRYFHVEKWRVGTIARHLRLHSDTVARVLAQAGVPTRAHVVRPAQIDAYLPFIHETLKKFPTLTASRLYGMAKERGYGGGPDHFRHLIARYRPRPQAEAYLRLRTLRGEQAQVDWATFGSLAIGRTQSRLSTCLGLPMCMCANRRQVNSPTIRKVDAASMASKTVRMRLDGKT
jgi:hypothetical protein